MVNILGTVLLTPNAGKMERVKDLLLAVAKEVEESQKSVLQYQLFEEISKEAEAPTTDRKIIVHLNFADGEAFSQYHALTTLQKFWAAIPEENLLAVPLDARICRVFGGFAGRS